MSQPLQVLIVEDNVVDAELVLHALREGGFEPNWSQVDSESTFLARLHVGLDLVLSDFSLPQFNGLRALELLKQSGLDIPFILLSGTIGEEIAVTAIKQGAADYLLKDRLVRLGAAVTHALAQTKLRRERQQADEALRQRTEELQSANEALRRSEHDFRILFDSNPMPMWVYDLATLRFLAVNDETVHYYGYTRSEFLAMTIKDIRTADEFAALEADLAHPAPRSARPRLWRHRKKDGTIIHVLITSHDLTFGGRKGRLVMASDETARRQAEDNLRASEERFRQMTENIDEVFWMTDPVRGELVYMSPAYERVWGRTCASLYQAAQTWSDAVHFEDRERIQLAAKTKQLAGTYSETYRICRPDGAVRWIFERAFPLENATGEVYRIVGVAQDVTDKKHLEAQFFRAQRLESIGTLASGIAHDLNNILAPIMMAAPLIRLSTEPASRERILSAVEASVQRGAKLVRQLLTFGRGSEGEKRSLSVAPVIHEVLMIARQTFPKNVAIDHALPEQISPIMADATQVHQILLNLCVNARDAMPHGGTLTIATENVRFDSQAAAAIPGANAGNYVQIEVTDTGTGMTREIAEKIFDPFFTTKEAGKGTGLGLATVLGLVKSHEGFVTLITEPGKGSKFAVHFPAAGAPKEETIPPFAAEAPPAGNGELVLVVDDEENIRDTVRGALIAHGYAVAVAQDGIEGVSRYAMARSEIKAVLTDLDMPNMDGLAMIRILRQLDPKLRIVVSSGVLNRNQLTASRMSELTAIGVTARLDKPYTTDQLLRAIHTELAN